MRFDALKLAPLAKKYEYVNRSLINKDSTSYDDSKILNIWRFKKSFGVSVKIKWMLFKGKRDLKRDYKDNNKQFRRLY